MVSSTASFVEALIISFVAMAFVHNNVNIEDLNENLLGFFVKVHFKARN